MVIYKPKGRAREYSPLALNVYTGCDHGCKYCYVPGLLHKTRESLREDVRPRPDLVQQVGREAGRLAGEDQVLLCFTGDPYCRADLEYQATRNVLEILLSNRIPVTILSKGGSRCLRDLDLFTKFGESIKVGATLTFLSEADSRRWEPDAAPVGDRLEALETLHENGVRTWVSFEPVIDPDQTLELLKCTMGYVDEFKLGKINNYAGLDADIHWPAFLEQAVRILREAGRPFYVKHDLRKRCPEIRLSEQEQDQDRLLVKPFAQSGVLF
ncbi:hypothetical protein ES707_12522 [subsurface metagenome]